MNLACPNCGKNFDRTIRKDRPPKNSFCSKQCGIEYRSFKTCKICGSKDMYYPGWLKKEGNRISKIKAPVCKNCFELWTKDRHKSDKFCVLCGNKFKITIDGEKRIKDPLSPRRGYCKNCRKLNIYSRIYFCACGLCGNKFFSPKKAAKRCGCHRPKVRDKKNKQYSPYGRTCTSCGVTITEENRTQSNKKTMCKCDTCLYVHRRVYKDKKQYGNENIDIVLKTREIDALLLLGSTMINKEGDKCLKTKKTRILMATRILESTP